MARGYCRKARVGAMVELGVASRVRGEREEGKWKGVGLRLMGV